MDTSELIVTALTEGATASTRNPDATAIGAMYQKLKGLIAARFSGNYDARIILDLSQSDPATWRGSLKSFLGETGADTDAEVIRTARELMALISDPGSNYQVNIDNSPESVADDGNQAGNAFSAHRPARPRRAVPFSERVHPLEVPPNPMIPGIETHGPPMPSDLDHLMRFGRGSEPAPWTSPPERVILIERCRGVQVGEHNEQCSVYWIILPSVAFGSPQKLADLLLGPDTPWARDVFSHDAQPDLGAAAGGSGSTAGSIVAGPGGDTLVIVRDSCGVQVGDHNFQHNEFRIRVAPVTVRASHLGVTSAREEAISRLRDNPGDMAAARTLAEDVARAASIDLEMDLMAWVTSEVGDAQIPLRSVRVHDATGIQMGRLNHASRKVQVAAPKTVDADALAQEILDATAHWHRPTDEPGGTALSPF